MINFTAIFYIFGSIIITSTVYKLWYSYQRSKNPITKDFTYIGVFLVSCLFVLGLISLFFPQNWPVLRISSFFAVIPLFASFGFGLRAFLRSRIRQISPNLGLVVAAVLGIIILFLDVNYSGHPQFVEGIIQWDINPIAHLIFSFLILVFIIPLIVTFIQAGFEDAKIRVRSFAMATGFFLAGIGTILNTSNFSWSIIFFGSIIMFFGFLSVAFAFFFVKVSEE